MIALVLIACTPNADTATLPSHHSPAAAVSALPLPPEPAVSPATASPVSGSPASGSPEAAPVDLVPPVTVEVQPGETLVDLAAWSGVTVEALAELNGFAVTAPLHVGAFVRIPDGTDFEQNRETALDERLERYFEAHDGLVGLTTRTVRTGDTAWVIAKEEGLPLWVVAAYNRPLHLSRIAIGDTLYLPVMGDMLPPVEEDSGVQPGQDQE
jgi:LysM repeat protein